MTARAETGLVAPREGGPSAAARRVRPRLRRRLRWLSLLPVVLVAALIARQRFFVPVAAHAYVVARGDIVREVYGRATIESRHGAELGFDLVGRISEVLVDEGDVVTKGQVVARLAPQQENADVRAASSTVPLANAALARLEADERRARATLALARTNATRTRALVASGSAPAQDLDTADQQLAIAEADLDRVVAQEIESRKQVNVASAATHSKVVTASRASLLSPFEGVVTRRRKDPGDPVVVGTTVLEIVPVDRLWARAWIDESTLRSLRRGMPAEVELFSETPEVLRGTVDRIGTEVDRQTHEALVDVLLDDRQTTLAIGQRADVRVAVERRPDVLRVPYGFVHHDGDGSFVLVDRGGRVRRARVQLGLAGRELVEVTAGLDAGDVVLDAAAGGALSVGRRWRTAP